MSDHVHLCLSIPPKYSVAITVGFLKGKSARRIHREYRGTSRGSIFGHAVTVLVKTGRYSGLPATRRKRKNTKSSKTSEDGFSPLRTVGPLRGAFIKPPALRVVVD